MKYIESMRKHNQGWIYSLTLYWILIGILLLNIHPGDIVPILAGSTIMVFGIVTVFYNYKAIDKTYLILLALIVLYFAICIAIWPIVVQFSWCNLLYCLLAIVNCIVYYLTYKCFLIRMKI